jgi:NSS family neurotransmitter:Na+ symporter
MAKGTENTKRGSFSGRLGYVLATAGSAVGLGNIWRFPYLAARYGGGIFLLVYLLLALTFGYTLMISESTLGRITRKSPVGAFKAFSKSRLASAGGWINGIIPMLIVSYYCVIGGWVTKYLFEYITGNVAGTASDGFFNAFISSPWSAELWFIVFAAITMIVIVAGVENGVERVSKFMMPGLVVLSAVVAVYSMTRPGALEGVKYFLVPDFKHFSWMTVVAALGQMFYSLSIAMGILITYGSYMKKDVNIERSTHQVVFFDSGIAVLAGLMIIPAVFSFSGGDPNVLKSGPSLMFVTMPKVFESMGFGMGVGILFFVLVLFAALTSAISLAETSVSTFVDELGVSRGKSVALVTGIILVLGSLASLGYSSLSFVKIFGMEILDFIDFLTNSVMMPVSAFAICMFIVYVVKVETIAKEVRLSSKFRFERMYRVFIKYIAPIFVVVIFISAILNVLGIIEM